MRRYGSRVSQTELIIATLVLLTFPAIFFVDVYLTPWPIAATALFAIPIMVTARFFGPKFAVASTATSILFDAINAWIKSLEVQTVAFSVLSLIAIGFLSVLWAGAERRASSLAKMNAALYQLEQHRSRELEESRARLLEFFSMVAHDLKGPLTTVRGYGQMLSRWERLPGESREKVQSGIDSATSQLTRLAEDLLDASRIGAGRFELSKVKMDLVTLLKEILEQQQATASKHQLRLETKTDRIEGVWDENRLAQAFTNLIGNAIKYSPDGGPVIVQMAYVGNEVVISVSDQGIGIIEEDVPLLFHPYVRLHRGTGIKGMGLGLYITKGIVEAHDGTISVSSEPGKGSTFTVRLPISQTS